MTGEYETRSPKDCKFFGSCSANLCPLDLRLKEMLWCPEENELEDICRNPEFRELPFIRALKKIGRIVRKKAHDRDDYFSYEMLNRNMTVRSGIRGIPEPPDSVKDSEKWYEVREKRWIATHPEMSKARYDELKLRGKSLADSRKLIQKMHSDNTFPETINPKGTITHLGLDTSQEPIDRGSPDD